ncbi:MAG: choice-of-anchor U domain-containing protein, partial [Dokdonella sp.]
GTNGSFQLTASGFPTAFTFSNTGSALPTGITLSPSGLLGGTPGAGTSGTYTLTFQVSNGVAPVGTQSFTLTIALTTLAVDDVNVIEGDAGTTTLNFMLTRSNTSGTASVDVQTADGTATVVNGDYVALPLTTITFANGVATQPVSVTVNGDTKFEPDETVLLNLSNPVNVTLGNSQGTGTIINDDPQPSISINDVSQLEGQSGTSAFTFTVSLSNPSSQAISVIATSADGTATLADMDYVQLPPTLVSFAAGQTSMPVVVSVNGDTTVESDENFFVNLSAPVNATILEGQGIGTIINDDVAITSFTGPTATGTGTFTATFTGGGANCAFDLGNSGLIGAPPGSGAVPPTLPAPGAVFAHGLFAATIQGCSIGSTLNLTYTYPSALPAGAIFWKYGPTLANTSPHWYQLPATISGASVSFTITDGGLGDDDLVQDGRIVDPAGPAVITPAGQPVQPVPGLSQFATLLLLLLTAGIAALMIPRRAPGG